MLRWLIKQNGERVLQESPLQKNIATGEVTHYWKDVPEESDATHRFCIYCRTYGEWEAWKDFNYCPMCSKKLKEEGNEGIMGFQPPGSNVLMPPRS